jgi:hypothetical protein
MDSAMRRDRAAKPVHALELVALVSVLISYGSEAATVRQVGSTQGFEGPWLVVRN